MMKLLERHIIKTILLASLLITLIIVGVFFLISLLGELRSIGEGDYGVLQAFGYVVLRLPAEIYRFSPLLILLGSLLGVSVLSVHRELMVMQLSGFSFRHLIYTTSIGAIIFMLGMGLIGEGAGPYLNYKAEIYREGAKNKGQATITGTGVWFHVENNFIHVENIIDRRYLEKVIRYELDQNRQLKTVYFAQSLSFINHRWLMKKVVKTDFLKTGTRSVTLEELPWNLHFNLNLLNIGLLDPEDMSLAKLLRFSRYLQHNQLRATEYQFEFWERIFRPIAALLMVLLALPFALQRTSLGLRLLLGFLMGIIFYMLNIFLSQLSIIYQIPPALGAILPLLILGGVGFIFSWGRSFKGIT